MSERDPLPDLPADVLALLDAERRAPGPAGDVKARVRARLDETLGGPSGDGGPPSGGGGGGGGAWLTKLGLLGTVAAIGAGVIVGAGGGQEEQSAEATAPAPPVVVPAPPVQRTPPPVLVPTLQLAEVERESKTATRAPPKRTRRAAAKPVALESLADEQAPLDEARAALARRDGARALAALASHRGRFPEGALTEEREALTVLALAVSGRDEQARAAAQAFLTRFPDSLHGVVVEAAVP